MLFDLTHILFFTISFILVGIGIFLCIKYIHKQEHKDLVIKISAIATVLIHYSSLWYHFLVDKDASVGSNMLFMAYPCNMGMWFLFIFAFITNKKSKFATMLAEFTFYLGVVGGIIGVVLNENYASTPSLKDYDVLKGLVSHVTMLFGCICLCGFGYMKVRVKNILSVFIGYVFMLLNAWFIIKLFTRFNIDPPDGMYLLHVPYESAPWFNIWTMGLMGLILLFGIGALVEYFFLEKEERWYYKLGRREDNKNE